jgi:hypothetical protein
MSNQWSRNAEKEASWRVHLKRQSSSGESIRGYCLGRGLSEASFHFWRREIANRDREARSSQAMKNAGLVAVQIVGEPSEASTKRHTLEIECPGGPVVRLREDVAVEIFQQVLSICQQTCQVKVSATGEPVRSC